MVNNLTDVFSGCCSFSLTSLCQIGLSSLLHYVLLGLTVSPIFGKLKDGLIKIQWTWQRFLLNVLPYFSGLVGFKYNLWKTVSSTDLGRTYLWSTSSQLRSLQTWSIWHWALLAVVHLSTHGSYPGGMERSIRDSWITWNCQLTGDNRSIWTLTTYTEHLEILTLLNFSKRLHSSGVSSFTPWQY